MVRFVLGLISRFLFLCPGIVLAQSAAAPTATSVQSTSAPTSVQSASPASTPTSSASTDKNAAEISSHDEATTFTVNVNLVLVRVVVRNVHGDAVGGFKKENFQLFDNGKPQVISRFSEEQLKNESLPMVNASPESTEPKFPARYIAYLFDDIHLNFADLARVRQAAEKHIATLQPTDRTAIFTTSGRDMLDFTADRAKLMDALDRLQVNSITKTGVTECPDLTYYMADLIENKRDPRALQAAIEDDLTCQFQGDSSQYQAAQAEVYSAALRELSNGDHESQVSLYTLRDVVRRMAVLPGQRSIVLVSPGFYNPDHLPEQLETTDRAVRSNVVISSLDARGLYTLTPNGDLANGTTRSQFATIQKDQFTRESALIDTNVLNEVADATGGTLFHNNNDFDAGLQLLSSPPSYSYLLGFSPQALKIDGKFHTLKVTVKSPEKLTVQARKGYFAPKHEPDQADQAKQDIEDALFSQEEFHAIPVELHTQFFKSSDTAAQVAVVVRVDLHGIHFKKLEGRNRNDLTIVSALFDPDGNYVIGNQKLVEMRVRDQTLSRPKSGITLKSSFDVKPGSYMVRLVVRDAEGQMSAENGAVEIPY